MSATTQTDVGRACEQVREVAASLRGRLGRPVRLMEICGAHTVSISRSGLRSMLGDDLALVSGPGCPVCVTDQSYIDLAIDLARRAGVTVATYGDMVRVPGRAGSLADARAAGGDVQVVYAAHQAVAMAGQRPDRQVVFLGLGFETTTPATALAVKQARDAGLGNFSTLTAHKLVLPAMHALLADPTIGIDGFLCPGHVTVILGFAAYEPIVRQHGRQCVVAGFEPANIVAGILETLRQLAENRPAAASVYPPATREGNAVARAIIDEVFEPCDARWRALGVIPGSGLSLRPQFAGFDAMKRFDLVEGSSYELPGCQCGQVIMGKLTPTDCPLFGKVCTPRSPIGPCMVSSEGSCSAYYKYHRTGERAGRAE